jgi:hypothetical protein
VLVCLADLPQGLLEQLECRLTALETAPGQQPLQEAEVVEEHVGVEYLLSHHLLHHELLHSLQQAPEDVGVQLKQH